MNYPVALYLQDSHDLRDGLKYVQYAEENGFQYKSWTIWKALYHHYKLIKYNADNAVAEFNILEEDM